MDIDTSDIPMPDAIPTLADLLADCRPRPPLKIMNCNNKRSRDQFERDLTQTATAFQPVGQQPDAAPRRIRVEMFGSLYRKIMSWYNWLMGRRPELIAIETPSGKRRAIASPSSTTRKLTASGKKSSSPTTSTNTTTSTAQQQQKSEMPGYYPEPLKPLSPLPPKAQLPTPPDSRPASSASSVTDEHEQQQTQQASAPKKTGKLPLNNFPQYKPMTYAEKIAIIEADQRSRGIDPNRPGRGDPRRLRAPRAPSVPGSNINSIKPAVSFSARPARASVPARQSVQKPATMTAARSPNAALQRSTNAKSPKSPQSPQHLSRDDEIDAIVQRAKDVQLSARKDTDSLREFRELKRKEQEREAARVKKEQDDYKKAAEAKIAAEAARIKAEQDAAEAKKKAEEDAERAKTQLIKPLSEEWQQKLKDHMDKNDKHVVAMSPDGNELTRYDFVTLLGDGKGSSATNWLNDEIVNAFLSTIVSKKLEEANYVKSADTVPSYVAFNTGWYTTVKNKGVQGISSWSRRKHIKGEKLLQTERIFFPINTGTHWMLLIISPKEKKIEYLDSLRGRSKQWVAIARQWLQMELGKLYKEEEWTEARTVSSMQLNSNDCGAFTCLNAYASASGVEFGKVRGDKMQDGRRFLGAVLAGMEDW